MRARISGTRALFSRAGVLFTNFFLIILAYYHIKPASRSLFIEELGTQRLPYVWIATALVLGAIIGFYHRLVARYQRLHVVLGSCLLSVVLLVLFRQLLQHNSPLIATGFYVFVDIFSVVLVEQFWSLTNTLYTTEDGKRWYGLVGTGGLLGGVLGGVIAGNLLRHTGLQSHDLLLVAAAILLLIVVLNLLMGRAGLYREVHDERPPAIAAGDWRGLMASRYIVCIATILLFAQLAQPLVEYKFISMVAASYPGVDARTAYLSLFFSVMGGVSIGVNLLLTPLVQRHLGVMAGLLAQPVLLFASTLGFYLQPMLLSAAVMKVSDRGLSYSINRASKELLYIPLDPLQTYQVKAWIDMFGYRLFKVLGSVLILLLTQWLPTPFSAVQLSWLTLLVCLLWILTIAWLAREYRVVMAETVQVA